MDDNKLDVLFVCTGNTCRSCMAEDIFKRKLEENGLREKVRVDSAGVCTIDGQKASENAVKVIEEHGGDISAHKSKQLTLEMIEKADYIFTMTFSHKKNIIQMAPEAYNKIFVIKEFIDSNVEKESKELAKLYKKAALLYDKLHGYRENEIKSEEEREELLELEKKIKDKEIKFINYDISDPFGGSREDYERIYRELDSSLENIIKKL